MILRRTSWTALSLSPVHAFLLLEVARERYFKKIFLCWALIPGRRFRYQRRVICPRTCIKKWWTIKVEALRIIIDSRHAIARHLRALIFRTKLNNSHVFRPTRLCHNIQAVIDAKNDSWLLDTGEVLYEC